MEKLDITAHGAHGSAFPGNQEWVPIAVCVAKADGTPVGDLVKNNFKVRGLVTNNTHIGTTIKLFLNYGEQDSALTGYYALFVGTADNNVWGAGESVFAVTVKTPVSGRATAQGRTLAVVDIIHPGD